MDIVVNANSIPLQATASEPVDDDGSIALIGSAGLDAIEFSSLCQNDLFLYLVYLLLTFINPGLLFLLIKKGYLNLSIIMEYTNLTNK
jgi:hypothetical protein